MTLTPLQQQRKRRAEEESARVPMQQGWVRLEVEYGKIYVYGPGNSIAQVVPGAALNKKKRAFEVSLTLETLRTLRKAMGVSGEEFVRSCTQELGTWAKAAQVSDATVRAVHARLAAGERQPLPWLDRAAAREGRAPYAPYGHQQVMASVACWLNGVAFEGDVGTGKTRAAIEAMSHRARMGHLDLIVVAGKKATVKNVWVKEMLLWADNLLPIPLVGIPVVARRQRILDEMEKRRAESTTTACPVLVVNHDVLHALEPQFTKLFKGKRVGFVVDESQKCRNPSAKVTQATTRLAMLAKWRLILTGTPVVQGPQDVWSQWQMIDDGVTFGPSYVQFRREWLLENVYTGQTEARSSDALHEIGLRMRRRGIRVTKEEGIPDLPPRIYTTYPVEMTPAQWKAYKELKEDLITQIQTPQEDGRMVTAANQLVMMLRLSEITSGFLKDESGAVNRFTPNPKLIACQELVEENIGLAPMIIWARYRPDIELLAKTFAQYKPALVYGGQTDKARDAGIEAFTDGRSRLLIGNQQAGGVGLNLQPAAMAVYYSQDCNAEWRAQSEGRNHRGGSQIHKHITYVDLIVQDSIDETVMGILTGKKSVADAVVDLRRHIGLGDWEYVEPSGTLGGAQIIGRD